MNVRAPKHLLICSHQTVECPFFFLLYSTCFSALIPSHLCFILSIFSFKYALCQKVMFGKNKGGRVLHFMGALALTVQVYNISPRATKEDLITFFSYCGNIDEIQLQGDGDGSQLAVVTFKQPYAFKTALLLNDAIIIDRRVCIYPLEKDSVPIIFCFSEREQTQSREQQQK